MTTITIKKTLISASFDVKTADTGALIDAARTAKLGLGEQLQQVTYAVTYNLITSFDITHLQSMLNKLCMINGVIDMDFLRNVRQWINTFFTKAKAEDLVTGCPISIKTEQNDDGEMEMIVAWKKDDAGKNSVKLPDPNSMLTKELAAKLVELLKTEAENCSVMHASYDNKIATKNKAKDTANAGKSEEEIKAEEAKKKVESAKKSINNSFAKAKENGASDAELRAVLMDLLNSLPAIVIEGLTPAAE